MDVRVNQEVMEMLLNAERRKLSGVVREQTASVIELSSSSSDSDSSDSDDLDENDNANGVVSAGEGPEARASKKRKVNDVDFVLPLGFLAPLPPDDPVPAPLASDMELAEVSETVNPLEKTASRTPSSNVLSISKQFWKAGDYDGAPSSSWESTGGMDHVRVHPKFLHSNATSHKWALGAFAELLDNSLDEVCNGATYVNVDVSKNKKDGNRMLVIEDDGGGMDPDKMRQCMSLGYSAKSKIANTIGQYGNGFKTSTMRLGADVIVFSRCCGKDGKRPTQSIGLLSYTFLTSTGKEDIVVPMLDYEWHLDEWSKLSWPTVSDWDGNVETIVQWSPFSSEVDLLRQFNLMKDHGTRIIIFNLWEDDQGLSELDFHADEYDIQLRGVNRDEKNIQMAKEFPNSRHFLTYRHSLRSYASIIYLRLPPNFRIILRGKDVEHHNIVNDMMLTEMVTYRPNPTAEGAPKDLIMAAVVTIGFVKDVKYHIDVQGFNVYHKNRLIKPFWRVWNATGSDGRGVIGILEANFVEPAHDKQGFERTTDLSRLETRLKEMQKAYWSTNCHKIGYAPQHNKKDIEQSLHRDTSPDHGPQQSTRSNKKSTGIGKKPSTDSDKLCSPSNWNKRGIESQEFPKAVDSGNGNGHASGKGENRKKAAIDNSSSGKGLATSSPSTEDDSDDMCEVLPEKQANGSSQKIVARSKAKEVKFIMPPRTRNAPPSSRKGKEVASSPRAPRRRNMQQPVPPAESSSSSSESEAEPIDVSEQEEQEVNLNSMTERQQQLWMKRQDFIAKEPIPERGVLLTVGGVNRKYTDTIDALGWGAFVRAPNRYCHEFVREFYSNLHRLKRNIIMIFGRPFTLSPDVIRAYYQLPRVSVEEDLFYQLERGLTDVPSRVEMVYTLTLGREPEWYKADNFRFKCGSLCREARFWWLLTQGKIQGNRSDSDVSISVQNLLFCIVTRQRFDVGDVLYNTFVTLQKKLKKGTLLKSSVSYPCLISELCQLQGIPVPPGATYGRPKSTLKQKHAEDDPTQTESCFDWHQRYYGMRGQEGWEEPAFPFPSPSEPEPQHEPQAQQQREPQPQQHPPSYGSWNTTDNHPTLQTLTSDLEALRWTTRSDIYQVRQEVGRIGRVVDQIRADQVQFLQEYRMDQVQRRAREERRDQHPFRRSSH